MSKSRIQSTQRKTRRSSLAPVAKTYGPLFRFLGIALGGGKTDKSSVAVVEYYPEHKKIFLARLFEKIKSDPPLISSDQKIHEILTQYQNEVELLAFDVPLSLPKCITCSLVCPGYELCSEPELKWFRNFYEELNLKKKPKKMFTPYTQRCVETYLANNLEEPFELPHTLGSNMAPLVARALFIKRRAKIKTIEVVPRISIWRLGLKLKLNKSTLRMHKNPLRGEESRRIFLTTLIEKQGVFIYQQDLKLMVENNHAFEAFICAYTAFLAKKGDTETRPEEFPKNENWVEFPK